MYIAITRKKYKDTYHEQILLRESYRENGQVKTRTIANLTKQPKYQVEAIAAALKNKDDIVVTAKNQGQGKTIGFSLVIIFIMKLLGIIKAVGNTFEAKIALVLITARIIFQGSRIQALFWAKEEDKILDLLKFDNDEKNKLNDRTIYLGLDYIQENQEKIENKLFKSYYGNNPPKKVFYDVTSSYVEGNYSNSDLVTYGYNRDGKKGTKQIVIGLLTDEHGHAISIHTYRGNTNDVKTFADQLDKLKNRFNLENIIIVGDGGMIKSNDITKVKELGYNYITSIGKPSIRALIKDQNSTMQMSLFDEDLKEIIDEKNNTRLILRKNPTRAKEIGENTQDKIDSFKEFVKTTTNYYNTHYNAKQEILEKKINNKISNLKLSSFMSCNFTYKDGDCSTKIKGENVTKTKKLATVEVITDENAKNIFQELDGCYVVKTSLMDTKKDTKEDVHKTYKTLIKVENAFKTLKTDYLEIRPLYLKTEEQGKTYAIRHKANFVSRIKGHVALSMISYNITLKLKNYIKLADLDFKSIIRKLSLVQTNVNTINKIIKFETISEVGDNLKTLFTKMNLKLPTRI